MRRFFRGQRAKGKVPPSSVAGSLSKHSDAESGSGDSQTRAPPKNRDAISMREHVAFTGQFSDLDKLLAIISEDEPSATESKYGDSVGPCTTDKDPSLLEGDRSVLSDSNETAITVPTRNVIGKKEHGLLTSFVYLNLLQSHRGSFPGNKQEFVDEAHDGCLNACSVSPRDIVVSSLQAHIRMYSSEQEVKNAWIKRLTLPVRVDDATLAIRKDSSSLSLVDSVANGALVRHEYARALEMYETLRRDIRRRTSHSDIALPLLNRLAILSFLSGNEAMAGSFCRKLIDSTDGKAAEFLDALIMKGFLQFGCGNLDDALVTWREASYKVKPDNAHAPLLWNNLACLQVQLGSMGEAIESLKQSLALQKQEQNVANDTEHALLNISITLNNVAVVAEIQHDYSTAIASLEESLLLQESILAEHHYVVRATKGNLERISGIERIEAKRSDSVAGLPISLEESKQPLFEECDGITLPRAMNDIGRTTDFIQLGPLVNEYTPNERVQESFMEGFGFLEMSPKSLNGKRRRSSLPVDIDGNQIMGAETKLVDIYNDVTDLLLQNEINDALELLKFCLRSHCNKYGTIHPLVASTLHNIGIVFLFADMYEKALTYFQQAASIRIAALSIDHPDVCATMMKVGLIQVSRRDFDNALVTFAQVLHSRRNAFGYNHPQIVNVLNNIACVHYERGGHVASSKAFEEALEIMRKSGTRSNNSVLALTILLSNHGFVLSKRGMHLEASDAFREATRLNKSLYPANHPKVALNLENLGFTVAMARLSRNSKGKKKNNLLLDMLVPLQCGGV
jgi:tetratricopeptide (TPR) repeat protein